MDTQSTPTTKTHIRASFRDAVYTNLNIGMVENYFCAFMLALGIAEVTAGFGITIAQFIGVSFQLLSISSVFRKWKLKTRILTFLGLQGLSMIPLIVLGHLEYKSSFIVISILGVYWACLLSINPPWNRLIGNTVNTRFRLKFFSIRNQFGQLSIFVGLILSGLILNYAKQNDIELKVFVWIFIAGVCFKILSWIEIYFFHQNYDIPQGSEVKLPFKSFVKRIRNTEQGKLIKFLFFFYITVHFSAPYFNPYMLSSLKLSYIEYMSITGVSFFGRLFMFKFLQNRAKSKHVNNLLILASLGIATTPFLWTISQNLIWIIAIEFLSGCYWAGFELSTVLLYYQKIEDHERTSVISYITFFNITGMVIGSLLGASFLKLVPQDMDAYLMLFMCSGILRLIVVFLTPHISFKGQIPELISYNRVFLTRPPFGALTRPILGKIRKKKDN
jgi:MFS family permease